ncbi:class I SAM-dependent methyltransferase [bacterium]|jgi:hypothetical protein|nr:class I SAM-dependent methyltransferase [bacterium]MBT7310738.1 class I SAM-dependent methyltransferase [bacterium]
MPEMYEIYEKHADKYDELVRAEDYQNNLRNLLHETVNWRDLSVIEGGVGTGRVTRLYIEQVASSICCDRAQHMLDFAQGALSEYEDKLKFLRADNLNIPDLDGGFDLFIEGWSFGHSVSDCSTADEIKSVTDILVHNATKDLKPGGVVILLETLGTNLDFPGPPHEKLNIFYSELEQKHGFQMKKIRTDYQFQSNEEAARIMGFFFGEKMCQSVLKRNNAIIPEWTGMWTKTI